MFINWKSKNETNFADIMGKKLKQMLIDHVPFKTGTLICFNSTRDFNWSPHCDLKKLDFFIDYFKNNFDEFDLTFNALKKFCTIQQISLGMIWLNLFNCSKITTLSNIIIEKGAKKSFSPLL